jgi:hypothetical protein
MGASQNPLAATFRPDDYTRGVFYRNSRVSLAEISVADGTSFTIFAGEVARDRCGPKRRTFTYGCGHRDSGETAVRMTYSGWDLDKPKLTLSADSDGDGTNARLSGFYWGSRHGGTVHFIMGDAAVRGISTSIDPKIMAKLATRAGRESLSEGDF